MVGLTGAGKSTIVKLLLRLYEPSAGRVTIDGTDARDLTFADLRGAIGLVSQDVFLFDGTVRENIAYGTRTPRPRRWRKRRASPRLTSSSPR